MKRPIQEEFTVRLDEVGRAWIRKPATLVLTIAIFPVVLIVGVTLGIVKGVKEAVVATSNFFVDCWFGKKD